jgi:6-phosphogluconolactonase
MDSLASAVGLRITEGAQQAITERGAFRIVLAGGATPVTMYRKLCNADTDWSRWQVYFGDERCLPANHPERNSVMAADSLLGRVPIPPDNIHVIPAELGAVDAAHSYHAVINAARPFDMVILGMGEDGHTASLFPGQQHDRAAMVHAVHGAPKPPADRVSLSEAALNDSRTVLVLVTGAGKHEAVQRWKRGEDMPVTRIHGQSGVDVYLDSAATSGAQDTQ